MIYAYLAVSRAISSTDDKFTSKLESQRVRRAGMRVRERRAREDVPRIMRRGNIFGSREPVNKVDSVGGFFSLEERRRAERGEGGRERSAAYTTTLDEEKENVKHAR